MTWPTPESYTRFKNIEPIEDMPGCYQYKPKHLQTPSPPLTPEEQARRDKALAEFEATIAEIKARRKQ